MQENKIDVQLVPPHMYRKNIAERAICTFKENFKSLRAECAPKFPKHIWCLILTQSNINVNLLRQARLNPQLSAYHTMWVASNYNRTPLSPPVTFFLVHEKPKQRSMWVYNGV